MNESVALGALGALAQENRLAIFRQLVRAGPAGMPAGALAAALDVANSTLSFHLAQLQGAGLIIQRRDGRSLVYSADFAAMDGLIRYLTENCCGGVPCGSAAPPIGASDPHHLSQRKSA